MVWSYYCIRVLLGVLIACREAKRQNLKSEIIFDFLFLALPIAIICARIYYVVFEWEQYNGSFTKMIAIWEGDLLYMEELSVESLLRLFFQNAVNSHFSDLLIWLYQA